VDFGNFGTHPIAVDGGKFEVPEPIPRYELMDICLCVIVEHVAINHITMFDTMNGQL